MRLLPHVPVLALDDGLQVGLNRPVMLRSLSEDQRAFIASLEGGRPTSDVERRRHHDLWTALERAGKVGAESGTDHAIIRVSSADAVTVAAVRVLTSSPVTVSMPPDIRRAARAHGVALAGRRMASPALRADLDIVTALGIPVASSAALVVQDAPHLLVRCDDSGADIGPVVVPGDTACAVCLGLWKTQAEPQWPSLALQCEARLPAFDAPLATAIGAWVAHTALQYVAGRPTSVWRVDADGARRAPTPPGHPACRCGAAPARHDVSALVL